MAKLNRQDAVCVEVEVEVLVGDDLSLPFGVLTSLDIVNVDIDARSTATSSPNTDTPDNSEMNVVDFPVTPDGVEWRCLKAAANAAGSSDEQWRSREHER